MKNKRINHHSIRGNIIYKTKIIDQLISENKVKLAKMLVNDLIKDYPDDNVLVYEFVRILCFEGQYKEAFKLLKNLKDQEIYYAFSLTILAILSKDMDSMKYYYYKYYANNVFDDPFSKEIQQNALKIYLQKIFEPDKEIDTGIYPDETRGAYYIKQLANYDENLAYKHIIDSHVATTSLSKTKFRPDIDVKELMKEVKKLIEDNEGKSYLTNWNEVYYIYYPRCGKTNGQSDYSLDYLVASPIYNTSDVLTIYPCGKNVLNTPINYPLKNEEVKGKELKRVSQTEKFNRRYGQN